MIQLCNKKFYTKYVINNININDFDKIFHNYINTHNKKFDNYYIDCEIGVQFDNNYSANIEINYHYNTDYINIKNYFFTLYSQLSICRIEIF